MPATWLLIFQDNIKKRVNENLSALFQIILQTRNRRSRNKYFTIPSSVHFPFQSNP
jgi:hypothetical protein